MGAKGYVVRGRYADGSTCTGRYVDLDEAASYRAERCRWGGTDVTIFAVAADGTETPLPSYEEALAELAHLKAHAATMPIALAPTPPGDKRPAVTGGQCGACHAQPPYHEATCERRAAQAHDLTSSEEIARLRGELSLNKAVLAMRDETIAAMRAVLAPGASDLAPSTAERMAWARLWNAVIDVTEARIAEENEQDGAESWRKRADKAHADAAQALRDLGVDVSSLLIAAERT